MKLLDTSILISLLRGDEETERRLKQEEKLATCFPVQCELYRGTELARKTEEGKKEVGRLLGQLHLLEGGPREARKFAELRGENPTISSFDLMIAAICIANGATLVTKDTDFKKIDGLETIILEA